MRKYAASVMTPEAQQAAMQPPQGAPMDPSMGGMPPQGAPMDPSMGAMPPQGAPMGPGGMPPQGAPMDPSMGGMPMAQGPQGGQIPPEILQDQAFISMLAQMAGIQFDPSSGMFIDPQGQPVPAEVIMQAYQAYMQQGGAQAMAGGAPAGPEGGMPPQGAPMDPSMGGMPPQGAPMDPAAMGGAPMGPEGGMPMDPMMGGMPPQGAPAGMGGAPDDMLNQVASAVMAGVENLMKDYTDKLNARLQELSDKIDAIGSSKADAAASEEGNADVDALRSELEAELRPVKTASVHACTAAAPLTIFDLIQGKH